MKQILPRRLYSTHASDEWGRLVTDPFHRLEFDETLRLLRKHLPAKGLVLDAGGGPGRYTIELAKKGYEVVLLDLVSENLKLAKRQITRCGLGRKVKGLIEGSVTDLSRFADNSFDAVLCLGGPLSHVHPKSARQQAVAELIRVAKRNAPVFISVMSKYGVMLATPGGWPRELLYKRHYDNLALHGDDYKFRGNAYCHFFTSTELKALVSTRNVKILELVGLEGLNVDVKTTNRFAKKFPQAVAQLDGPASQAVFRPVRRRRQRPHAHRREEAAFVAAKLFCGSSSVPLLERSVAARAAFNGQVSGRLRIVRMQPAGPRRPA